MAEHSIEIQPWVGWLLVTVMGVLWVCLGLYLGRKAKSLEGFMVAGRNVGLALGSATAVATWITSNTIMLAPQFGIERGVWGMLAYSTAAIGLLLFAPMSRRIRQLMPQGYTSVEFIRLRYGKVSYVVFLLISIFYSMTWLVSMAIAAGMLLNVLAGIPYVYGMAVVLTVCVLYTLFGGLYAVIGTDFIQSLVILIGLVVVVFFVLDRVSIDEIHMQLQERRPALLGVMFTPALLAIFNSLFFGIGEVCHSNVWWSRAFAMRKGVGSRAYTLAGLIWIPIPIVAGFLGLAAPALGVNIISADTAGPEVAAHVLGYAGAIFIFIVVFCSLASSIDSLLAATSDVVTKEVVQQMFMRHATDEQLRRVAGFVIVALGLIAMVMCLPWASFGQWRDSADGSFYEAVIANGDPIGTLGAVLFFAGPLVGSTIWPILTGLYTKKMPGIGSAVAMVAGSTFGLIAYFKIDPYCASLVGTGVSCLMTVGFVFFAPTSFNWSRLRPEIGGASP